MTMRKNNDENITDPNESNESDITELMFQLSIEKYHSLLSILSDLRTKAGIFLAMLGVIASIGFSLSAYGVINQYINIGATTQKIYTGGIIGGVDGNSEAYVNNSNVIDCDITSIATINQIFTDGLATLQIQLGIVLLILITGLIIVTICYVYLLNKSLEIRNILLPFSDDISQLQNAHDKSVKKHSKSHYQKKAIFQLNKRIFELEDTVSFFKKQFKKLDKLVITFCVIGITAIMFMNFDLVGFVIAVILVGCILIWAVVIGIKLYREKETIRKWTESKN